MYYNDSTNDAKEHSRNIKRLSHTRINLLTFDHSNEGEMPLDNFYNPRRKKPKSVNFCLHEGHCIQNAVNNGFFRSFAIGYIFKCSLSVGKLFLNGKLFKQEGVITEIIFGSDSIKFGQFLGSLNCGYKLLVCVFRFLLRRESVWFHPVAGFLAAFSIFIDERSRLRTLSLFLAVRVIHELLRHLIRTKKKIPDLRKYKFAIFSICQILICYSFVFCPKALDPVYRNWIANMGNLKGLLLSTDPEKFYHCSLFLHDDPSCLRASFVDFCASFKKSIKVYFTAYVLPLILFRNNKVLDDPFRSVYVTTKSVFRSSLFLSSYIFLLRSVHCIGRNYFKRDLKFVALLAGFFASLSLFVEQSSRHTELLLYLLPRAIETLPVLCPPISKLTNSNLFSVFFFQMSIAMLMYFYKNEKNEMKSLNSLVMDIVFGFDK